MDPSFPGRAKLSRSLPPATQQPTIDFRHQSFLFDLIFFAISFITFILCCRFISFLPCLSLFYIETSAHALPVQAPSARLLPARELLPLFFVPKSVPTSRVLPVAFPSGHLFASHRLPPLRFRFENRPNFVLHVAQLFFFVISLASTCALPFSRCPQPLLQQFHF